MKITSGYDNFDDSDYIKSVNIIQIHKPILTKKHILKNRNIIGLILSPITGILMLFLGIYSFGLDFNYSLLGNTLMWITMIGIIILGIFLLVSLPHSIKEIISFSKKFKNNDFVLVKTDIIHIYEDMRPADRDSSANCYLTCDYQIDDRKKRIKVKARAIDAVRFKTNLNAYFLFTIHNGAIEEKPIALYFGDSYKISHDIKVI